MPSAPSRAGRNLPAAIASGVVLAVVVLVSLFTVKWIFALVVIAAILIAVREFVHAFRGVIPNDARFLRGESIGELFDRVLPALERLTAEDWDTALAILHGGVNRALLSYALTGERMFLGQTAKSMRPLACAITASKVGARPSTSTFRLNSPCRSVSGLMRRARMP